MSAGNGNGEKHRAETKVGSLAALTPEARLELDEVGFREQVALELGENREQTHRLANEAKEIREGLAEDRKRAHRSETRIIGHLKLSEKRQLQRMEQVSQQMLSFENRFLEERLAREHLDTQRKVLEKELDAVRAMGDAGKARDEQLTIEIAKLDGALKELDARTSGERTRRDLPSLGNMEEDSAVALRRIQDEFFERSRQDAAVAQHAAMAGVETKTATVKADIHVTTERRLMTPRAVLMLLAPTGIVALILGALIARGC